jgi:hypothetical protein
MKGKLIIVIVLRNGFNNSGKPRKGPKNKLAMTGIAVRFRLKPKPRWPE